jgi:hypothetical protein
MNEENEEMGDSEYKEENSVHLNELLGISSSCMSQPDLTKNSYNNYSFNNF